VLVFAGLDPSGGAGLAADLQAVAGQGAHALTVCTALTVQDNDRVYGVQPVEAELVLRQARALADKVAISAIKIGITGSAANAQAIAQFILWLRERQSEREREPAAGLAELPVVLDPVLASGHGDLLSRDDAAQALSPLLPLTTVLTPNGPEAQALTDATQHAAQAQALTDAKRHDAKAHALADATRHDVQAQALRARGCRHVLITGGHGDGDEVINRWYGPGSVAAASASRRAVGVAPNADLGANAMSETASPGHREWRWPRLDGAFHGSGCTLASAIAAQLALGLPTAVALEHAQHYVYHALRDAYAIAAGQRIPLR
jgi:hydroxymethylpyrimidine/phosphomethylpyrimidine kinase